MLHPIKHTTNNIRRNVQAKGTTDSTDMQGGSRNMLTICIAKVKLDDVLHHRDRGLLIALEYTLGN